MNKATCIFLVILAGCSAALIVLFLTGAFIFTTKGLPLPALALTVVIDFILIGLLSLFFRSHWGSFRKGEQWKEAWTRRHSMLTQFRRGKTLTQVALDEGVSRERAFRLLARASDEDRRG